MRVSTTLHALADERPAELARALVLDGATAGAVIRTPDEDVALLVVDGVVDWTDGATRGTAGVGEVLGIAPASAGAMPTVTAHGDVAFARIPRDLRQRLGIGDAELGEVVGTAFLALRRRRLLERAVTVFGQLEGDALTDIEAAAEWGHLRGGEVLVRQGDAADSLYVLVTGRLAVVREGPDGSRVPLGEIGPGETVGEMAFFTGEPRSATVEAVRECLLLRFTNEAFERVTARHPAMLREVTRVQIERLRRSTTARRPTAVTTICVVPAGDPEVAMDVCLRLREALAPFGAVLHLTAAEVDRQLDRPGTADALEGTPAAGTLRGWLGEQELGYRFVVYEADPRLPHWSRRAVAQADRILVGDAHARPEAGDFERGLLARAPAAVRRTLVLVHAVGTRLPSGTARWLVRPGIADHFHLRRDRPADLARLARTLAGRAIGLALGGGGARALAQIGLFEALDEFQVPIDVIGGTSIGSAMAAQRAMGWDRQRMMDENRRAFVEKRVHRDWTLPLLSLIGDATNRSALAMYGEVQIEDLWLPCFTVSSSLTTAERVVRRRGSLWRAVIASASLPGVSVPMHLDGHLLVDGALTDNLPGGVLRDLECGHVMVCRASVDAEADFTVDRLPSLGEVLRGMATGKRPRHPGLLEVVVRAGLLSSVEREHQVMREADLAFQPPVEPYGLMQFEAMDRIVDEGHAYARARLAEWRETGVLDRMLDPRAADA